MPADPAPAQRSRMTHELRRLQLQVDQLHELGPWASGWQVVQAFELGPDASDETLALVRAAIEALELLL